MQKQLLIEKYIFFDYPKHKTDKFEFIQLNKSIVIKKDKAYYSKLKYNWFQVGYISLNRRDVPLELYKDSLDYMSFKEKFCIKTNLKNNKGDNEDVFFCLHSITQKEDCVVFGFKYKDIYHTGDKFNEEKGIPIPSIMNMLDKMEKKIKNYSSKEGI